MMPHYASESFQKDKLVDIFCCFPQEVFFVFENEKS